MTLKVPAVMSSRSTIPVELSFLFEDPPLLRSEDERAYHALAESILAAMRPEDGVMLVLVKDFVEAAWDSHRWRTMRAAVIRMSQKDALMNILQSLLGTADIPEGSDRGATAEAMAERWLADPNSRTPIRKILGRLHLTEVDIEAQAAVLRMGDVAAFDQLIEAADRRGKQALAAIEMYRASLAARLQAISSEMLGEEMKKIPLAPSLDK